MKSVYIAILSAGFVMAGQAQAASPNDPAMDALAKSKNCFSCHNFEKKIVGPAYKDVAAKYKGDAGALATLSAKVRTGGKGVWGQVPMPPNNVTEDEAKKLVAWILAH